MLSSAVSVIAHIGGLELVNEGDLERRFSGTERTVASLSVAEDEDVCLKLEWELEFDWHAQGPVLFESLQQAMKRKR